MSEKSDEKFVKIVVIETEILAQLLDSVLRDRGIPHVMRSYHDTAYDGVYQSFRGWGHVEAPERFEEEIKTILDDLNREGTAPEADTED